MNVKELESLNVVWSGGRTQMHHVGSRWFSLSALRRPVGYGDVCNLSTWRSTPVWTHRSTNEARCQNQTLKKEKRKEKWSGGRCSSDSSVHLSSGRWKGHFNYQDTPKRWRAEAATLEGEGVKEWRRWIERGEKRERKWSFVSIFSICNFPLFTVSMTYGSYVRYVHHSHQSQGETLNFSWTGDTFIPFVNLSPARGTFSFRLHPPSHPSVVPKDSMKQEKLEWRRTTQTELGSRWLDV